MSSDKPVPAAELADALIGSPESAPDWLIEQPLEYHQELDQLVFQCASCCWWCGVEEQNQDGSGDLICDDCFVEDG